MAYTTLSTMSQVEFAELKSSTLFVSLSVFTFNPHKMESHPFPTPLQPSLTHLTQRDHNTHLNHLLNIVNKESAITVLHVPSSPANDPSPALGANTKVGTTEIVFFYFPSSLTDADKEEIMASVDKVRPVIERSESLAVFDGWALEEEVPNPGPQASEGEKSRVFVNMVGWVDVEAHMRFQGSREFEENIHYLLELKDLRHIELYHAKMFAV